MVDIAEGVMMLQGVPSAVWRQRSWQSLALIGRDAQLFGLYVLVAPGATPLGLYTLPFAQIDRDLGIRVVRLRTLLGQCAAIEYAYYHEPTECIWVVEAAAWYVLRGRTVLPREQQSRTVQRLLEAARMHPLYPLFVRRYGEALQLDPLDAARDVDGVVRVAPAAPPSPPAELSVEELVRMYNELTPDECPAVVVVSPERRRKALRALQQFPQRAFWEKVFAQMRRSRFLRGFGGSAGRAAPFVADFDWLLSRGKDGVENVVKVHDGRYSG